MLTSQVATFVPGQMYQVTERDFKFGSSSFNGDGVIQQNVRKGLERKKELRHQVKHKTYPPPMGIRN